MSYSAIVVRLENVRAFPGADRLKLANCCLEQVIVGLDNKEGDLGVFFQSDGCLSQEMLFHNNLYRHSERNKDRREKGYFDDNGRVRCQTLRGEKSYGFWTPLNSLEWTGYDISKLKEGEEFTSLNNKLVCSKYVPTRQISSEEKQGKAGKKQYKLPAPKAINFKEHFDTKQFRRNIKQIPDNSIIYLTIKAHGTSGRTGRLQVSKVTCSRTMGRIRTFLKMNLPRKRDWKILTGTRRVNLNPYDLDGKKDPNNYLLTYGRSRDYRVKVSHILAEKGIPKGYTLYYEIVGYTPMGSLIMGSSSVDKIDDKKTKKFIKAKYGNTMRYTYGCEPFNSEEQNKFYSDLNCHNNPEWKDCFRVLVYRITFTNESGLSEDLSWNQVKQFCKERGLETVVQAGEPFFYKSYEESSQDLLNLVESLHDGPDPLDERHIREGVCLRIESEQGMKILKDKTWVFKQLEQGFKDTGAIDAEEQEELDGQTE